MKQDSTNASAKDDSENFKSDDNQCKYLCYNQIN